MRFQFSRQSGLYGRKIRELIDRVGFVPLNEEGVTEYIFGYDREKVPNASEEPDLYMGANISEESKEEVELSYPGTGEMVILMTLEKDDRFRGENPDVVSQNELFRIDDE